jgi:hypothetical protein
MGFEWIYWHLIHYTWNHRQLQRYHDFRTLQFTVMDTLGYSAFASHILARNFNTVVTPISHMESSLHSLVPFLPLFCQLPTPETPSILILAASGRTHRKHRFLYCCVLIQCCRDVLNAQLHINEHSAIPQRMLLATSSIVAWHHRIHDAFLCCVCMGHYLSTAVSLPPLFLLSENMPQYEQY